MITNVICPLDTAGFCIWLMSVSTQKANQWWFKKKNGCSTRSFFTDAAGKRAMSSPCLVPLNHSPSNHRNCSSVTLQRRQVRKKEEAEFPVWESSLQLCKRPYKSLASSSETPHWLQQRLKSVSILIKALLGFLLKTPQNSSELCPISLIIDETIANDNYRIQSRHKKNDGIKMRRSSVCDEK